MAKGPTLAEVLAAPDDLALRSVWADALQQQGDPRGEFVALQLAQTPTYEGWVREAELIAKHGKAWAGPLARYFARYVFEGGLLAGGVPSYALSLDPDAPDRAQPTFTEPAWRVVTTLVGLDVSTRHLLETAVPIRRLHGLWDAEVATLLARGAKWPRAEIVELGVRVPWEDGFGKQLASRKAFPKLRSLIIEAPRRQFAKVLAGSPLLARIERLGLEAVSDVYGTGSNAEVDPLIAAAVASKGALREVVVRFEERGHDLGWQVTLRRTTPGPFTELVAWWRQVKFQRAPKELAADCVRILNLVERERLRSVRIEIGKPLRAPTTVAQTLAEQLAEMPLETCVVPWQATAQTAAVTGERRWHVELTHCDAIGRMADIWKVFGTRLGVPWDAMSADDRGKPALGKHPAKALSQRAKRARRGLALVRTGTPDQLEVRRHGWIEGSFSTARTPGELASWFAEMIATFKPDGIASCGLADSTDVHWGLALETYGAVATGWVIALPPLVAKGLTAKHLAKLGARAVPCPDRTRVVFTIGDDPAKVDDARARAFAAELVAVLDAIRAPKAPTWFAPAVRAAVAPIAKRLKLTKTCDDPVRLEWAKGKRFIRVRLDPQLAPRAMKVVTSSIDGGTTKIRNAADVTAELASVLRRL